MSDWRSIAAAAKHAAAALTQDRVLGEARFRQLFEENPDDGMLFLERGRARARIGDFPGARADLELAIEKLPMAPWKGKARSALASLPASSSSERPPSHATETALVPTTAELLMAHQVFAASEPRSVDFDVAARLLEQALERPDELSPATPTAMLLQSWNFAYYQDGRRFDADHFRQLDTALDHVRQPLLRFRARQILGLNDEDRPEVERIFTILRAIVGRVGAAKVMHLWAPTFFPLWDNPIANAYGFDLTESASQYWTFMRVVREQVASLTPPPGVSPADAAREVDQSAAREVDHLRAVHSTLF